MRKVIELERNSVERGTGQYLLRGTLRTPGGPLEEAFKAYDSTRTTGIMNSLEPHNVKRQFSKLKCLIIYVKNRTNATAVSSDRTYMNI